MVRAMRRAGRTPATADGEIYLFRHGRNICDTTQLLILLTRLTESVCLRNALVIGASFRRACNREDADGPPVQIAGVGDLAGPVWGYFYTRKY